MSTISNKFIVNAIDDGSTLHGALSSDRSLTQGWTGSAAVPNWTNSSYQPTIYLTLLNGADYVVPKAGYVWKYNGEAIDFSTDTRFQVVNNYKPYPSTLPSYEVPAIKIVQNLAGVDGNVDTDLITFEGQYHLGDQDISFASTISITITSIPSNGISGVVRFVDNISEISQAGQTITMYGELFDAENNQISSGYTVTWYLHSTSSTPLGTTTNTGTINLNETQVTDIAVVIAVFSYTKDGTTLTYTVYQEVDDKFDDDMLYIYYGNGVASDYASLKRGESVVFNACVGYSYDSTPRSGWAFKLQVIDAQNNVVTTNIGDGTKIPNVIPGDPDSLRNMSVTSNVASCTVEYDVVKQLGNYMTGIVFATES